MNPETQYSDVVIVGGGPVGLYLAGILLQKKISVTVLEQKKSIDVHSKSLGIHPVSLELFDEAGIVTPFLKQGIKIKQGVAYVDNKMIGVLSFQKLTSKPFNFILALPQYHTEKILENWVRSLEPEALIRGAKVCEVTPSNNHITITCQTGKKHLRVKCLFAAGCDGKTSLVRNKAGIPFKGNEYPDTYIMGDFEDNTGFGSKAVVYLHRHGLIESFPLPDFRRRWVVKTDRYISDPPAALLQRIIRERIGHSIDHQENYMMSGFGVQHLLAETFYSGRIILAGDSAHVVSPIGGQGMNLGWLTAKDAADAIESVISKNENREKAFSRFSKRSKKRARTAAKRAWVNTRLGRSSAFPLFKNFLARGIVHKPFSGLAAKVFTMRYL